MPIDVATHEAYILLLVAAGYVPVLRAYASDGDGWWLFAGYTALLIGRIATIAEQAVWSGALNLIEHYVGIALAGVLFAVHYYRRSRTDRRTTEAGAGFDDWREGDA